MTVFHKTWSNSSDLGNLMLLQSRGAKREKFRGPCNSYRRPRFVVFYPSTKPSVSRQLPNA